MSALPEIPNKRYFTIGEVGDLCGVKPHVLRYWEQEFPQLKPLKRRGNRRYYQPHEVLMVRRIRELLYEQGYTISGARNQLEESKQAWALAQDFADSELDESPWLPSDLSADGNGQGQSVNPAGLQRLRQELEDIRLLLSI